MGRTVPSYRMALEKEVAKWERFGKALRGDDKKAFEEMLNACRLYASAAGAATRPVISEVMFMSILLAHQKMLREIKTTLEDLRESLRSR